ncbi:hypothetical protein DSO57_1013908 [Entomophthora muscae]|uniref:Uncharacterized protein n=1 Tax=Entomophthora muscae TaxID=34485 RepID=A0ACC2UEG1_9FUNG|nr:hypothetical protein DSO57_1013908 [Entomophthora muscae]
MLRKDHESQSRVAKPTIDSKGTPVWPPSKTNCHSTSQAFGISHLMLSTLIWESWHIIAGAIVGVDPLSKAECTPQLPSQLLVSLPQPAASIPREIDHLISTAVLKACPGIGGYQQGPGFFGPSPEGLGHNHHYASDNLTLCIWVPGLPWCPPLHPVYGSVHLPYWVLTYFAGSSRRDNIHTKVFRWLMTVHPTITALAGVQLSNLQPYLLQAAPAIFGYYAGTLFNPAATLKVQGLVRMARSKTGMEIFPRRLPQTYPSLG